MYNLSNRCKVIMLNEHVGSVSGYHQNLMYDKLVVTFTVFVVFLVAYLYIIIIIWFACMRRRLARREAIVV